MNDGFEPATDVTYGGLNHPRRRPFERLLRKLLRLPNRPAIMLVHAFDYARRWLRLSSQAQPMLSSIHVGPPTGWTATHWPICRCVCGRMCPRHGVSVPFTAELLHMCLVIRSDMVLRMQTPTLLFRHLPCAICAATGQSAVTNPLWPPHRCRLSTTDRQLHARPWCHQTILVSCAAGCL